MASRVSKVMKASCRPENNCSSSVCVSELQGCLDAAICFPCVYPHSSVSSLFEVGMIAWRRRTTVFASSKERFTTRGHVGSLCFGECCVSKLH